KNCTVYSLLQFVWDCNNPFYANEFSLNEVIKKGGAFLKFYPYLCLFNFKKGILLYEIRPYLLQTFYRTPPRFYCTNEAQQSGSFQFQRHLPHWCRQHHPVPAGSEYFLSERRGSGRKHFGTFS